VPAPTIHPREILKVDFLDTLEISQYRLAEAMRVIEPSRPVVPCQGSA